MRLGMFWRSTQIEEGVAHWRGWNTTPRQWAANSDNRVLIMHKVQVELVISILHFNV